MLTARKWITIEFVFFAAVVAILIGLNTWYVTNQVSTSQRNFCAIVSTRSTPPPPATKNPPEDYKAYVKKVTTEYQALKEKLGC